MKRIRGVTEHGSHLRLLVDNVPLGPTRGGPAASCPGSMPSGPVPYLPTASTCSSTNKDEVGFRAREIFLHRRAETLRLTDVPQVRAEDRGNELPDFGGRAEQGAFEVGSQRAVHVLLQSGYALTGAIQGVWRLAGSLLFSPAAAHLRNEQFQAETKLPYHQAKLR